MDGSTVSTLCIDNSSPVDMKDHIDSLLAAVSFSDEVDRSTKLQRDPTIPSSRLAFSTLPSQPNQPPVNARLLFEGSEYTSENTYANGFGTLHSFTQKTDEFHAKLQEHGASHNCIFIRRWLETYHTPARLRQDGLLVLRDIYCDKSPSCSLGCFAAMIVQHSIRDITLYKSDGSDSAMFGWRDVLLEPAEREELHCLYNELSQDDGSNLVTSQGIIQGQNSMPPSQEYLQVGGQFNSEPPQPAADQAGMSLEYYEPFPPPLQQSQPNLPSLGSTGIEVEWYPSSNPSYGYQQEPADTSFDFENEGLRPGDQYDEDYTMSPTYNAPFPMSFTTGPTPEFPSPIHTVHPIQPCPVPPPMPSTSHQQPSYPPRNDDGSGSAVSVLKESQPFQIFIRFLSDLGTFLDLFSVKRAVPSPQRSEDQLTGAFARRRYSEFIKDIQKLLFDSLSSSSRSFASDPAVIGIIAAADLMVSVGNLQCLRQVEEYLISLGQVFISTSLSFKQFASDMLKTCVDISLKPGYRQFCYLEVDVGQDSRYSQAYVAARLKNLSIPDHRFHLHPAGEYGTPDTLSMYSKSRTRSGSFHSGSQGTSSVIFDDVKSQTNSAAPSLDPDPAQRRCERCPRVFNGKWASTSLSRHLRTDHHGHLYGCPYCGKTDKRSCNLSKHIEKMHPGRVIPKFGMKGTERLPHSSAAGG